MNNSSTGDNGTIQKLWEAVSKEMSNKISKPSFDQWISPLSIQSKEKDTIVLIAPSEFIKDWVNQRYKAQLIDVFNELAGQAYKITITCV